MDSIIEGFKRAFLLIFNLDAELLSIIFLSLRVSGTALLIVSIIGLPLSALITLKNFRQGAYL